MTTIPPLHRRWRHAAVAPDSAAVATLMRELRLPEPLCRLLVVRGFTTPDSAKAFLRPGLDALHDPFRLAGMGDAVERLRRAIRDRETIFVHGDYDVDGICAATLYARVLRKLGARVTPFVPHRMRDGYDLGHSGIRRAIEADARVVLTADCGIVAHDAVGAAAEAGLDVIVTDHHTPGATLPPALAVVNPKRPDCGYPEKGLCGTAVAFKVLQALTDDGSLDAEELNYHLDLVALATVADVMPLRGENRVLTRFGLRVLGATRIPGLRALVTSAGLDGKPITAGHLSHVLGPRLNAVGRLGDAGDGLRLLLEGEDGVSARLAGELEIVNQRRQAVDREILAQALELLEGRYDARRDRAIVLAAPGWHAGVIGIVASRLVERLHRPVALIAMPEGEGAARGSARSIPGFDLLDSIRACGSHLERFGGHAAAAGFDIRPDRIDAFRSAFCERARGLLQDEPAPELRIDMELPLAEVTSDLVRYLAYAGPFGVANPTPVFVARAVRIADVKAVGAEGQHLRLRLADADATVGAIGFRMSGTHGELARSGEPLDVAFQLQEDSWRGRRRIQAKLVDLRPAG